MFEPGQKVEIRPYVAKDATMISITRGDNSQEHRRLMAKMLQAFQENAQIVYTGTVSWTRSAASAVTNASILLDGAARPLTFTLEEDGTWEVGKDPDPGIPFVHVREYDIKAAP